MDNQEWINDFVYVTKRDQILIVLTLKCVEVGANVDNINVIFLKHMVRYRKLSNEELDSRWMCLGYDKDFVLKGYCIKVTSKLKSKFLPLWSMCTTWHIELIWQLLCCRLNPSYKISRLFFVHYLKRFLEFIELDKTLKNKSFHLLRNVKTRWIAC